MKALVLALLVTAAVPVYAASAARTACYTATGHVVRVIDGDTFDAELRVWLSVTMHERVRVYGVDTPEMKGATRPAALLELAFAEEWLRRGPFHVRTCARDSFGRLLGIVTRDGTELATALIGAQHGVPYDKREK